MAIRTENTHRVRRAREARGLSQAELAAAANLTRQSVGAIEAGRATPSVEVALRIAKALEQTVESLFGDVPTETSALVAEPVSAIASDRLLLAHIGGRWVAHGLGNDGMRLSADALLGASQAKGKGVCVDVLRDTSLAQENVVVLGCAGGLGVLTDRLNAKRGPGRFVWLPGSSTEALEALASRQIHVAGVHLVDGKTGDANVADVRRIVRGLSVVLVTLGRWDVGLLVSRECGKKLRSVEDLGRPGLRIAVREKGAGARRLLDRELRAIGSSVPKIAASAVQARGHLDVARAVALGAADTGIATRDAALLMDLDFVPLTEERYDLVIPAESNADPRIQRLLDGLSELGFRRELARLGYDVRSCGDRVAEVIAA